MPPASMTTRKANRSRFFENTSCEDFLDCCHHQRRHERVDRRQGIEKHDCRFAAEAVRDDLGLYVVRDILVCSSARTIANRSNLAGHWARIGVVGALRAVWRAGSIIWPELSSKAERNVLSVQA
jgi:hypothetical protein